MVNKDHKLSVRRQCKLLTLTRSNLYYDPKGESSENRRFMEIINKQFLETAMVRITSNGALHAAQQPQKWAASRTPSHAAHAFGSDPLPGRVSRSDARDGIRHPTPIGQQHMLSMCVIGQETPQS
jgi:hypothetical protein